MKPSSEKLAPAPKPPLRLIPAGCCSRCASYPQASGWLVMTCHYHQLSFIFNPDGKLEDISGMDCGAVQ